MNFEEMKSTLENMLNENYADFTKAIIAIEKDISDPDLLQQLYQAYMMMILYLVYFIPILMQ